MSEWARGTGRYTGGGLYVVEHGRERLMVLMYHQMVGSRRTEKQPDNVLVIPANDMWPELALTQGLTGYWELGDNPGQVFATELPEGSVLYEPAAPIKVELDTNPTAEVVATTLRVLTQGYGFVKGPNRAVWFVGMIAGLNYVLAYDPKARIGAAGELAKVLRRLDDRAMNGLISKLRQQAFIEATPITYFKDLVRDNIELNGNADTWVWPTEQGAEEVVCPYGQAAVQHIGGLIASGMAVQIGLNRFEGTPERVIGFLARSEVAYSGVHHEPLKLLVPCPPGEQRSVLAVVEHDCGYGVWGFTVARKFDETGGRVVSFAGSHKRQYFIDPATKKPFIMPGVG